MKDGISLGEKQTRNKNVLLRVFKRTEHFRSCLPTPKNDNFRTMLCTNSQTLNIQSTEPSHNSVSPNFLRTRFSNGVLNRTSNRLFYHLLWKGKLKGGGASNEQRKKSERSPEWVWLFSGTKPCQGQWHFSPMAVAKPSPVRLREMVKPSSGLSVDIESGYRKSPPFLFPLPQIWRLIPYRVWSHRV